MGGGGGVALEVLEGGTGIRWDKSPRKGESLLKGKACLRVVSGEGILNLNPQP